MFLRELLQIPHARLEFLHPGRALTPIKHQIRLFCSSSPRTSLTRLSRRRMGWASRYEREGIWGIRAFYPHSYPFLHFSNPRSLFQELASLIDGDFEAMNAMSIRHKEHLASARVGDEPCRNCGVVTHSVQCHDCGSGEDDHHLCSQCCGKFCNC